MPVAKRNRRDLPECVYFKNGAYYFVKKNVWKRLSDDYAEAMALWATMIVPTSREDVMTMEQLFTRYQLEIIPKKAPRTQKDNLGEMRFLRAVFGHMPITAVTTADVVAYVEAREAKTRANREIALLSHVFNKAILWGYTKFNPCSVPGIRNTEEVRDRYVTDEEVDNFKKVCPEWLKVYVDLKLLTGLRQQNLLALKHEQLEEEVIHVEIMKRKKGEKKTRLRILRTPEVDAVLARLKTKSGNCFQTISGTQYTSKGFNSTWTRAMEKFELNGGKRFHEHDLRGKVATDIGDAHAVKQLLGHKKISQSEDYMKARASDVVAPAKRKQA